MDFIFFQVDDVEIIFAELLQAAQVFIANRVALAKGGAFEFPGANLGDVMGQLGAHRIL